MLGLFLGESSSLVHRPSYSHTTLPDKIFRPQTARSCDLECDEACRNGWALSAMIRSLAKPETNGPVLGLASSCIKLSNRRVAEVSTDFQETPTQRHPIHQGQICRGSATSPYALQIFRDAQDCPSDPLCAGHVAARAHRLRRSNYCCCCFRPRSSVSFWIGKLGVGKATVSARTCIVYPYLEVFFRLEDLWSRVHRPFAHVFTDLQPASATRIYLWAWTLEPQVQGHTW